MFILHSSTRECTSVAATARSRSRGQPTPVRNVSVKQKGWASTLQVSLERLAQHCGQRSDHGSFSKWMPTLLGYLDAVGAPTGALYPEMTGTKSVKSKICAAMADPAKLRNV